MIVVVLVAILGVEARRRRHESRRRQERALRRVAISRTPQLTEAPPRGTRPGMPDPAASGVSERERREDRAA
jgi:hypothetical protein